MAKSSKSKSGQSSEKDLPEVEPIEEQAQPEAGQAAPEADTAEVSTDAPVEPADDTPEAETPAEPEPTEEAPADEPVLIEEEPATAETAEEQPEAAEPAEPAQPSEPTIVRETVVEKKGGFVPMVFGGVVAAGLGFAASHFGVLSQGEDPAQVALRSDVQTQGETLASLTDRLGAAESAVAAIDLAPLQTAMDGVEGQFADINSGIASLGEQIDALSTRMSALEKQPMSSALSPEAIAAYERELESLTAAVEAQKAEVETLASSAIAAQEDAAAQAQLAKSRSALAEMTARLQAGEPYADAMSALAETGVVIPAAISAGAAEGLPTQTALVTDFPDAARAALGAARAAAPAEETGGGLGSFLQKQLGVRSTAPREGDDPDAVLSRAEAAVKGGDLATALTEIAALPAEAQDSLADWTARATLRRDALDGVAALSQELNQK